nr:DUF5317 family protein [uncultured Niameybacter sp.]
MIETLLIAILVSYKKGYDLKFLWKEKAFYPLFICEGIYWIIQILLFNGNYVFLPYVHLFKTLYLCSTLFIVFRFELYKYALLGSVCVIIGGWCNDLAIWANGGKMPVFPTLSHLTGYATPNMFGVVDQLHILGSSATNLKILTDYIDLGYSILSIGDVLIRLLPFILLYQGLKYANLQKSLCCHLQEEN